MKLNVEAVEVETIKSYRVKADMLLPESMKDSQETLTEADFFALFVQEEESEVIEINEELLAKVRQMPQHSEAQIIPHVNQVMPNRFADEEIRLAITEARK